MFQFTFISNATRFHKTFNSRWWIHFHQNEWKMKERLSTDHKQFTWEPTFFGDYSFKMMAVWRVVKNKKDWVIIRKSYSRKSNENDRPKQIAPQQFLPSHVSPQLKTHTHTKQTQKTHQILCFACLTLWLHSVDCPYGRNAACTYNYAQHHSLKCPFIILTAIHLLSTSRHQLIERLNKQKVRIRMIFSSFKDFEEFSDLPTLFWMDLKFQWRFYNTTAVTSMTYSALKCLSPSALLCRRLWCIGQV